MPELTRITRDCCNSLSVRGIECVGDLLRDRQRLLERNWAMGDTIRERWPLDELEDERVHAVGIFEA